MNKDLILYNKINVITSIVIFHDSIFVIIVELKNLEYGDNGI